MPSHLKLHLTDELCDFIDENFGDGTLYVTAGEFVRDLLRQRKHQLEASQARDAILEGYQDAIAGRMIPYTGNLRSLLRTAKSVD